MHEQVAKAQGANWNHFFSLTGAHLQGVAMRIEPFFYLGAVNKTVVRNRSLDVKISA